MARHYKNIIETLEDKIVEVDSSAFSYTFRLTHAGTTCKIRGVQSKYADSTNGYVYSDTQDVEVGSSYVFKERYDAIEIFQSNGAGNFVIEQGFDN